MENKTYDYTKLPMNSNSNLPNWMNGKPNQKQLPEWCKQPESCGNSLSGKCICPKPNGKQFKECSLELVSQYFDKFSKEDLKNKILPLLQTKIKTI